MAQYQHLPIYKATYELLTKITHATSNFPKAYKYSLGDKLRAEVVEMVVFVFRANSARIERVEHGFDALGYVIRPHSRYLRRSTVRNGFKKIDGLCRSRAPLADVLQTAHSYFGIFNHANAWKLQGRLAAGLHKAGYGAAVPFTLQDARFPR